jgi:branched-subunit amino acid ABC-type transport system permease component
MVAGPEYTVLISFLVLLVVLVVKPSGIAGKLGYE